MRFNPIPLLPGQKIFQKKLLTFEIKYAILPVEREVKRMKKKEVNAYKKMTPEQLAAFIALRRRGGMVPAKKGKGSYKRSEFKKGE